MNEANKAKALSDRANQQAQQALRQAQNEAERAKQAQEQARADSQERYKAQQEVREMEYATNRSKMTYKKLFMGQLIFTIALAFFVALTRLETLLEMLRWFPTRWGNIKSFVSLILTSFVRVAQLIQGRWELGNWAYLIVAVITVGMLVGLFFIVKWFIKKIKAFYKELRDKCNDKTFKDVITTDIVLISFFVSLFIGLWVQKFINLNPMSLWLILSFIGISLWHIPEIKFMNN